MTLSKLARNSHPHYRRLSVCCGTNAFILENITQPVVRLQKCMSPPPTRAPANDKGGKPVHSEPCKICPYKHSFKPVCCVHKRGKGMAPNKCVCGCAGGKLLPAIACITRVKCIKCRKIFRPVCCKMERRRYRLKANRCLCLCCGRVLHNMRCFERRH